MNFCENCIHYEMCKTKYESLDGMVLSFFPNNSDCQFFKNKADFVEVVRCEKCTRSVDYEGRIMCNKFGHKFQGEWYGLRATTKDHFCGHGTRK